jgi:hypothetical protein
MSLLDVSLELGEIPKPTYRNSSRSTGNFPQEKSSTSLGFFSVLISRLRAAAHALFPPRGEEKKSKVEAECHAPDKRINVVSA